MSIKCMNWAWDIKLPPTIKLILMSLADNANDSAQCFPSVKFIAQRCCISRRSTQRGIKTLQQNQLLVVHPQFRKDGSHSSNLYTLNLPELRGVNLTPPTSVENPPIRGCHKNDAENFFHQGVTDIAPPDGTCDTPLTTIEPPINTTTTNENLIWPKNLNIKHRESIQSLIKNEKTVVVQLLLDELAGQKKKVDSPASFFHKLLQEYKSGNFVPARALNIQSSRKWRKHTQRAVNKANKMGEERLNRLVKQLLEKEGG